MNGGNWDEFVKRMCDAVGVHALVQVIGMKSGSKKRRRQLH